MFGWATEWFQLTASGLINAVWTSIWHWGLGIGVIILCIAGAFLSPVGKQGFAGAAFAAFLLLVAFGIGQKDEKAICEARVKVLYLKAHPRINRNNIARNWRVSPTWDPSKPPNYRPLQQAPCSYMGYRYRC
jgi:hypothetical protein